MLRSVVTPILPHYSPFVPPPQMPIVLPNSQPGIFEYVTPKPQIPREPVTVADIGVAGPFKSFVLPQYIDGPIQGPGTPQLHEMLQKIQNTLQEHGNRLEALEDLARGTHRDVQNLKDDMRVVKEDLHGVRDGVRVVEEDLWVRDETRVMEDEIIDENLGMLKSHTDLVQKDMEALKVSMAECIKESAATKAVITKVRRLLPLFMGWLIASPMQFLNLQINGNAGPLQEVPFCRGDRPWSKWYPVEVMADGQPVKK
ncbi:hypothetical protein E1B28_002233 [Marasmius oreades]|uniref:Uncharacterized protein n=1 Tax=Marasmius oreades TaxID=181124 RepID=A0A9P7UMW5_9AGAR|nr:uncharacterized protein E1B28_002233 [Marasmius oreades]KAG7086266.1 hypothetical protein E1B28_002233 [Marasmius oreades]